MGVSSQIKALYEQSQLIGPLRLTPEEYMYLIRQRDEQDDIETAEPLPFMDEDLEDLAILERRCDEYFPQDRDMHGRQP